MKQFGGTAALLAALMLVTITGCASPGQPAEQAIGDTVITAGVKTAIATEPSLKVSDINVETQAGIVQLSGFVSSAEDVASAAAVARTVKGVKSVRNDLRLK
jgi:osmotically-inducible protein OsmY